MVVVSLRPRAAYLGACRRAERTFYGNSCENKSAIMPYQVDNVSTDINGKSCSKQCVYRAVEHIMKVVSTIIIGPIYRLTTLVGRLIFGAKSKE